MSNLIQKFATSAKGTLTSTAKAMGDAALSELFAAGNRYISQLKNSSVQLDNMVLLTQRMIDVVDYDALVSGAVVTDVDAIHELITDDLAKEVLARIESTAEEGEDQLKHFALTLQDGSVARMAIKEKGDSFEVMMGTMMNQSETVTTWSPFITQSAISMRLATLKKDAQNQIVERYHNLGDITAQFTESASVNSTMISALKACVSGKILTLSDFSTCFDQQLLHKYESVRRIKDGCVTAYSTSGIRGIIMYLLSYAETLAAMTVNSDGLISFTSNKQLTPASYLIGLVNTAITVVVQIVSIIVAIINPVLGFVFSTIASLVWNVIQAVKWDSDSTKAKMNVNVDTVCLPSFPHGMFQWELESSNAWFGLNGSILFGSLLSESSVVTARVPGGYLMAWPGEQPHENGDVYKLRVEFHPDMLIRSPLFGRASNGGGGNGYVIDQEIDRDLLLARILSGDKDAESKTWLNATEAGVSDADDRLLRTTLLVNASYFYFWLLATDTSAGDTVTVRGQYLFDHFTSYMQAPYIHSAMSLSGAASVDGELSDPFVSEHSLSWAEIASLATSTENGRWRLWSLHFFVEDVESTYMRFLNLRRYYDTWFPININAGYPVAPAKYDSLSFCIGIAAGAALALTAAGLAVVGTLAFNRWRRTKQTIAAAKAEGQWQKVVENPTVANANAYDKLVKKNNFGALVYGGTKYSRTGFWNGDPTEGADGSSDGGADGKLSSALHTATELYQGSDDTSPEQVLLEQIRSRIG